MKRTNQKNGRRVGGFLLLIMVVGVVPSSAPAATYNINSFPRLSGETDDAPRISRALAAMVSGDILQFNTATYSLVNAITGWKNGITLQGTGWSSILKVNNPGFYTPIYLSGRSNITLRDIKLQGYAQSGIAGANAISLVNCSSCTLDTVRIESFPWQGIVVSDGSNNNTLDTITVTNCKDASGGRGILLYGGDVANNTLDNITAQYCTVGISLNFAHDNTIGEVTCVDNSLIGFTLDGIGSGEGAANNTITKVTAQRNGITGGGPYGGIYLGNDSNYNTFGEIVATANHTNGLCMRGVDHNGFEVVTCSDNDTNGIRSIDSGYNSLGSVGLTCNDNTQNGIILESGNTTWVGNCSVGCQTRNNGQNGVKTLAASDNNLFKKLFITGNGQYGAYVTSGSTGNIFAILSASGNVAGQTFWGSSVTVKSTCP